MFNQMILDIKTRRGEIERLEKEIKDIRAENNENVLAHGNFQGEYGSIEIRRGMTRCTYDAKVVDTVLAALWDTHPALAGQLDSARKVSFISETWVVK